MLLSKPELSMCQRVRRMFEAFGDKARLGKDSQPVHPRAAALRVLIARIAS